MDLLRLGFVGASAALFHADCDGHHHAETHVLSGARAIVVDSHAGNVEIRAAEVDTPVLDVIVHGEKTRLDLVVDGDVAFAETVCKGLGDCAIDYIVTAPPSFDVKIEVRQGDITLQEIRGLVSLDTGEGKIELDRVEGRRIEVATGFGDIVARGTVADVFRALVSHGSIDVVIEKAPDLVTVDVGRGSVDLALPGHEAYQLDLDAAHGEVRVEAIESKEDTTRHVRVRAEHGDIAVRSSESTR